MVREYRHPDDESCRLLLTPNRSLTTRQAYVVFTGLAVWVLAVGTAAFFAGLPLVLPYSGLEVVAIGAAMYTTLRWTRREQRVEIAGDHIRIAKRAAGGADAGVYEFQRAWARLILETDAGGWYPSRLKLRSHGREVEIGEFLAEEERVALSEILAQYVAPPGARNQYAQR